jgi:predicted AAA+ superfamily ATPase
MKRKKYHQVILEQKDERDHQLQENVVIRELEDHVNLYSNLAQIISGIRRSGKSTLACQVYRKQNFAYINFDDERLLDCSVEDLNLLLELLFQVYGDFKYLLLDEIQNVDGWSLFVNRLLRMKLHLIITGSNSKLLSVELATHLTGRFSSIELFPFSFKEYLAYKQFSFGSQTTKEKGLLKGLYTEYSKSGGFPEVVRGEPLEEYIAALFEAIVTRDIIFRHNIRYIRTFRDIAIHLINNFASELSFNRIKTVFGLGSENTAKTYVSYLEEAYLILSLPKFSFKKQEQLRYRKIYAVDPAFISVISTGFSENSGKILENIVFLELRRRAIYGNYEIYYYKKQFEIDFVLYSKGHVIELIQVCENLMDKKTRNREIRSLVNASSELKSGNLKIITSDEDEIIKENGLSIKVMPVIRWLIES